jgi:hypothetical protein
MHISDENSPQFPLTGENLEHCSMGPETASVHVYQSTWM